MSDGAPAEDAFLSAPPSWGLRAPGDDPVAMAAGWLARAEREGVLHPRAVTLSTASPTGAVSARTVILKAIDPEGFVFESESYSRKGQELADNPSAAMTLYWREVHRQICVTGRALPLPAEESDRRWAARPRPNQAAAVVSHEGGPLGSLGEEAALRARAAALTASGAEIARPATYVAYRLTPATVELWEGSEDRLHRRVFYERAGDGSWEWRYLQP